MRERCHIPFLLAACRIAQSALTGAQQQPPPYKVRRQTQLFQKYRTITR